MKKILISFLLVFITVGYAQEIGVDEIIIYRKLWPEDQIIVKLEESNYKVRLTDKDIAKLKQEGFSDNFIKRLLAFSGEKEQGNTTNNNRVNQNSPGDKFCQIRIKIFPENSGTVVIQPPLNENGKIAVGTEVYIQPIANGAYLFERWQGDKVGYYPLHFIVREDVQLEAYFAKPYNAPPPPKINDETLFRETRKEGFTYFGEATGVMEGRGQNTDWGIQGQMDYKYIYQIHYTGRVEKNDGLRIREIRTFDLVNEALVASKFQLKLDVSQDLQGLITFAKSTGKFFRRVGIATRSSEIAIGGATIEGMTGIAENMLEKAEKYTLDQDEIDFVLGSVEKVIGKQGFLENWKKRLSDPKFGKIIGYTPQMKMLEGKTFELEYEDGVGLIHIEAVGGEMMNVQERELIERAFYLSDHFIFRDNKKPNRPLQVGDSWDVDARNIAGALDPRLRHEIDGDITLIRNADISQNNRQLAVFNVQKGHAKLLGRNYPQRVEGNVWIKDGKILYDAQNKYVYRTNLSGKASYKELSQDHLLFGTRFSSDPIFSVVYECICKPSQK